MYWYSHIDDTENYLKHCVYKKYIECCLKGLLTSDDNFKKKLSKFYNDLEKGKLDYVDEYDAEEWLQEFRNLFKNKK